MPQPSEQDVLFAVTAMQLRFATEEQIAGATERAGGATLREALLSRGVLSAAEADAIEAVVRQRLSRSGEDAAAALEDSGAHDTLAPGVADPLQTLAPQRPPDDHSSRFRVLRVHQEGGLGRVSVASDEDFGREIALKEILPGRADEPEHRKRFVREAEITGALEHPGVVPVYSRGEHADGRPYYAMRFIRGVDLQQACDDYHRRTPAAEKPLRFRQLMASFVSVCQTIHYAHNRGVLHRDLKPSNIMLGDYGETLVVDWGLAKASGENASADDLSAPPVSLSGRGEAPDATQAGRVVGTPAYMSPEQADGRIDLLTQATDIYGLGATLYHLMTGRAPFVGDDIGVLRDVRQARYPKPSDVGGTVPKPLEAICLKALARRPGDRYPTAGELALDVERYLADQPVSAHAEPLAARLGRWSRNHRGLVLSAVSAATVAIVMLSASVALLTAANRRERTARQAATASAAEAEVQREQAEQNSALARRAVQDYYVMVSEETLLQEVGMQPLRDKLLRQALAYYQQFVADRGDDPALLSEVALAHYYTGQITEAIDSPEAALAQYDRAVELQQQLTDGDASPAAATEALARAVNARGGALRKLGRLAEARGAFDRAAADRQRLVEAEPDNADYARQLANSVMNAAVVALQSGDAAGALTEMNRAQALRRAYVDASLPADAALRRDLAKGDYNLAAGHLTRQDYEPALAAAVRAADGFAAIAKAAPRDFGNRVRLANAQRVRAVARLNLGRRAEGIADLRATAETLRELAEQNPEVVSYAGDLAGVRINLAEQLAAGGDAAGAVVEISQGVAALRAAGPIDGLPPRLRRDLGVALRFWGETLTDHGDASQARRRLRESAAVLRALVKAFPGEAGYLDELSRTDTTLAAAEAVGGDGADREGADR